MHKNVFVYSSMLFIYACVCTNLFTCACTNKPVFACLLVSIHNFYILERLKLDMNDEKATPITHLAHKVSSLL